MFTRLKTSPIENRPALICHSIAAVAVVDRARTVQVATGTFVMAVVRSPSPSVRRKLSSLGRAAINAAFGTSALLKRADVVNPFFDQKMRFTVRTTVVREPSWLALVLSSLGLMIMVLRLSVSLVLGFQAEDSHIPTARSCLACRKQWSCYDIFLDGAFPSLSYWNYHFGYWFCMVSEAKTKSNYN